MTEPEILAYMELKSNLVKVLFEFTDIYAAPNSTLYPQCASIMAEALESCLNEVKIQGGIRDNNHD